MSNSIKTSPYSPYCCGSNSTWKVAVNRELRRTNRQLLKQDREPRLMDEEADIWSSPQDGYPHYVHGVIYSKKPRMKGKRLITVKPPEVYEKAFRK